MRETFSQQRYIHYPALIGNSPLMRRPLSRARSAARSSLNVLIMGECGTGKDLLAEAIHHNSDRKDKPLLQVDTLFSDELMEGELFGYEDDMESVIHKDGVLEAANSGTVVITDIDVIKPHIQTRLYEYVSDDNETRIIATTMQDIHEMSRKSIFRGDLLTKLSGITIRLPPLRERKGDLELLLKRFLDEANARYGKRVVSFDQKALDRLHIYNWPGNVRELANTVDRVVALATGRTVTYDELPAEIKTKHKRLSVFLKPGMTLAEAESQLIDATLDFADGDEERAARMLGVGVRMVQRKLGKGGGSYASERR